ncbi:hypothetical protein EDEG_02156 [Edhazardia aedis USNM 41457]|uniref:BSD domain-containing protein n=1 Tax=Edhazardia aedis (strain USNM 41457) TaxID=1003232 RepID=J9DLN5_EDHAE|nr:hypothetical protein EDEG_02156 [Edhazardia aedis USNM 41457]|eukprot:EJW03500.1 hypothetical protein EDEG_02156 [Edhazardia aedis USNM 41457]
MNPFLTFSVLFNGLQYIFATDSNSEMHNSAVVNNSAEIPEETNNSSLTPSQNANLNNSNLLENNGSNSSKNYTVHQKPGLNKFWFKYFQLLAEMSSLDIKTFDDNTERQESKSVDLETGTK